MSKNVLILMGSPREQGNTQILCNEFKKGVEETNSIVEEVFIQEKNINPCLGCNKCYKSKNSNCLNFEDDMIDILDKMDTADIIVFATPVYFYTLSGQMKILIDRTVPRYTKFTNKEVYYILAAATPEKANLERTVEDFRGYMDCLPNSVEKGIVYGVGAWEIGEINDTLAMNEAYEMGKNILN